MNQQARIPCARSARVAVRAASTRLPLSIASSTSCDPDSTPSHTSSAPAWASARATSGRIRFTRLCIMNGVRASRARTSSANRRIHSGVRPKMSSANHTWPGPTSAFSRRISSATAAGERWS